MAADDMHSIMNTSVHFLQDVEWTLPPSETDVECTLLTLELSKQERDVEWTLPPSEFDVECTLPTSELLKQDDVHSIMSTSVHFVQDVHWTLPPSEFDVECTLPNYELLKQEHE